MNVAEKRYLLSSALVDKKIRCDATSEANVEQCSSCKRAGVNCSFSRVPMKRGPTKGLEAQYVSLLFSSLTFRYIRELEDRLVSLEYSVQTKTHIPVREHSPPRRHIEYNKNHISTPPEMFKQPHPHSEPVKLNPVLNSHPRNHHDRLPSIDAIHGSPPIPTEKRHSVEYFRQPFHPSSHRPESVPSHPYNSNHLDQHAAPDRRNSVDQSRRLSFPQHPVHERSSSFNDAIGRRPPTLGLLEKPGISNNALPIDDAAINRYYDIYHSALPVLPHTAKRFHTYLAAAPLHVRNALLHAVYALTALDNPPLTPSSPHSPPTTSAHIDHTLKACDLLGSEAFVPDERGHMSLSRNLLHMQTLLLLALNADKRCFAPPQVDWSRNSPAHTPQETCYTARFVGSIMGAAWGCANAMRLGEAPVLLRKRTHEQMENQDSAGDVDSEENLARRAWWIMVILDRWRSVSTSSTPLISDDKITLRDSDRQLLGEVTFHLVRVSLVLGHVAEVPTSIMSPDVSLNLPQLARFLNGEAERVRETAEIALSHDALLNVAFWHCKLLILSHTTDLNQPHGTLYRTVLSSAKKVTDLLQSRKFNPQTPLIQHILGSVVVQLVRLSNVSDTREEANKMLHDLIGDRNSSQFDFERRTLVEGYDVITKKFLDQGEVRRHGETMHAHIRRHSESHYNDSNGIGRLAHLADLAVGEGSDRDYQPHKHRSDAWRSIGGGEGLDGLLKRHGYLSALQALLQ